MQKKIGSVVTTENRIIISTWNFKNPTQPIVCLTHERSISTRIVQRVIKIKSYTKRFVTPCQKCEKLEEIKIIWPMTKK